MKIIGCQLDIVWEDKKANYRKVDALLKEREIPEGSLIVLPEMFATGFSMRPEITREEDPSPTEGFLSEVAERYRSWVLAGLVGRDYDGVPGNQAVVVSPDGELTARYTKLIPFPLSGEGAHYPPGNEIVMVSCSGFAMVPFICFDLRFPELFRFAARHGADFYAVIANWPAPRDFHWRTLLQARAIENQAYVLGVNRCGDAPNHHYCGGSLLIDPQGEILADAGSTEAVFEATVDPQVIEATRQKLPFLGEMRPVSVQGVQLSSPMRVKG